MIAAIVAVDKNFGIGYQGQLLEHIPEDIKFFKNKTSYSIVIMGRKTYDSLHKKPLPNRLNIVISNKYSGCAEGIIFMTYEECKLRIESGQIQNAFIIGGESIYKQFLSYCDIIYLTYLDIYHINVDTFFPNIDKLNEWKCIYQSDIKTYNKIPYQFKTYSRH